MAGENREGIHEAFERRFTRGASWIADASGRPAAFTIAVALMVVWAVLGPFVGYSEIWQLAVNTGTTIVTFLMVFIIQNSQNRDTRAIQIKIDELIRATQGASNSLLDIEGMSASEISELHRRYCQIAERAKQLGYDFDTGSPDVPPAIGEAAAAVDKAEDAIAAAEKKAKVNGTKPKPRRRAPAKTARAAAAH